MKHNKITVSVDVWAAPGCDTRWSVSEINSDGEEIVCIGGDDTLSEAWAMACERAEELGVPARIVQGDTNEVIREWSP